MIFRELGLAGLDRTHRGFEDVGEFRCLGRGDLAVGDRFTDRGDRKGEVLLGVERRQVELDGRTAAGR